MDEWITIDDLRVAYEGHIPDDDRTRARLTYLIALAQARLAKRVPRLQERITAGTLDPILVTGALAEIILRPIRNPRGVIQEGAGGFYYRLESAAKPGAMVISDEDILDLLPETRGAGMTVGTIQLGLPGWGSP